MVTGLKKALGLTLYFYGDWFGEGDPEAVLGHTPVLPCVFLLDVMDLQSAIIQNRDPITHLLGVLILKVS
jgi:hypothetical protein